MKNRKLSVIIPARNEQFLKKTIEDVLKNSTEEIEVIAVIDEGTPEYVQDERVTYIKFGRSRGMRACINAAVAISTGDYIMKLDGHCMVGEGFDKILKDASDDCTVQVPTRKRLDAENWCIQEVGKPDINYMYLSYPEVEDDFGGPGLNGKEWVEKNKDRNLDSEKIVDLMSFQGSGWFMEKSYFYELELMDEKNYGHFWNEAQEIGLKAWLGRGRVIRNKNTWYAHLHKGKKYGRGYFLSKASVDQGASYTKKWMQFRGAWDKQVKPLSWLIKHFCPPTWNSEKLNKLIENGN